MKTYSESRIELRNLQILKKMLEKSGDPKSRNDGTVESRNGRITERRKITPNPKRWNRGITERQKITPKPKRRNRGITESWNGGKYPQILTDGMTENHPKILKDGITENQAKS